MSRIIGRKLWITIFVAFALCFPSIIYCQNTMTAADIAQRCRESLNWQKSFSMRIQMAFTPFEGYGDKGPSERDFTLKYDANTMQGEWTGLLKAVGEWIKPLNNNDPCLVYSFTKVMTPEFGIDFENYIGRSPESAKMTENAKERLQELLDSDSYGGHVLGRMGGNGHLNISEFLISANDLTVRPDMQIVNGLKCYVLEGTTRYGKAIAWIAPDKGYSPAKWTIQKGPKDLLGDKPIGVNRITEFEVIEFEQQGKSFIPKQAKSNDNVSLPDGTKDAGQVLYEISEIQLNPDFAAQRAFKVNLPEGTRVAGKPGIKLIWKNNKVMADVNQTSFDEIDKTIEKFKQQQ